MLADDAVPPQQSASMTIGPLGQREMKGLVPIAVVVEKRDDALRFPRFRVRSPAGLVGWGQHVGLSDAFPESAICGKRIHHVSYPTNKIVNRRNRSLMKRLARSEEHTS